MRVIFYGEPRSTWQKTIGRQSEVYQQYNGLIVGMTLEAGPVV